MGERNKVISFFKSNDPEKLVVFHSSSLQNEIRFYLNDTQYFTAIESEKGFTIKLEEETEKEEKYNKKNNISAIREFLKDFLKIFSIALGILILCFISLFYLSKIINNIFIFLIIINIIHFIISIEIVVILETTATSFSIKSKHSAEHMMVNFLEINKRLPKNIEEVKKSSRFSPDCSRKKLIEGTSEGFIQNIVAIIFTFIASVIVSHFSSSFTAYVIVFFTTYFLVIYVAGKTITKYNAFNFIIKPIKKVLTNVIQCASTTSKVKDKDIIMAYSVAKEWLQVVYPEFYNENENNFWKQYFKVNN